MANNLSNYAETAMLDWIAGGATPTRPTTRYLALFTATPGESGGGTEVSGSGYARQTIAFAAASSGATSNSGAVTFTASGGSFGTVTSVGIFDASTSGNLLWYGPLTASKTIADGDSFQVAIGAATLALD